MAIARPPRPVPGRDRPARWLTAVVLASTILGGAVAPALAVDPAPSATTPSAVGDASPTPGPSAIPLAPDASVGPAAPATPGPGPEASTAAGPTPGASPSATPAVTPSPAPTQTATPAPTGTPAPTPTATAAPTATPGPTPTPAPTATPWPTPAWPTTVTTLGTSVRFHGLGYGHGVGMSQHGARGRAEAGQSAEQILAAYFRGASLSRVSPSKLVRVLVLASFRAASSTPLILYGRGGTWALDGVDRTFPAGAQLKAWRTDSGRWRLKVTSADGSTVLHAGRFSGDPFVRPLEASSFLQLHSKPSIYDTYRGSLRLIPGSTKVSVVNHIGLDQYLRGVAPVEMPSAWAKQAVRAQVIAARSYAVKELNPDTGTFDVYDDTRSQVYRGIEGERGATDALIAAEPGAVIRYTDGKVIKAFFFSTGGGATENNEYVFVSSSGTPGTSRVPYLRGITDRSPAGIPYDAGAPFYSWSTSSLSRDDLSAMFAQDSRTSVGSLSRLDLRRRGVSGRLYQVVLYGTAGTKTVSADVFRAVYNARKPSSAAPLRSNLFDTNPIPGA